ncbi:MAG: C40 family peptidase [Rhodospirillaceae bacterium]|nr:C40 family peptidase [Rhodospirillaceae bacterium]
MSGDPPDCLRAIRGIVPVRVQPSDDAEMETELLHGETFQVDRRLGAWLAGRCGLDGHAGFVRASGLMAMAPPTHRVRALRSFIYPAPDIRRPPIRAISFGGLVRIVHWAEAEDRPDAPCGGWAKLEDPPGGWLPAPALAPVDSVPSDAVEAALMFAGAPYLWGGRSSLGIDAPGLVQVALAAAGITAPRTLAGLAACCAIPNTRPERGDLAILEYSCGLMVDGGCVVHASPRHMCVVVEPADQIVAVLPAAQLAMLAVPA